MGLDEELQAQGSPAAADDTNGYSDFNGMRRSNDTHESVTDPDSRLLRKSDGTASMLCYLANLIRRTGTACDPP